jgi:Nucleotidyl transferase AbiEii toxin, Type IV TA system
MSERGLAFASSVSRRRLPARSPSLRARTAPVSPGLLAPRLRATFAEVAQLTVPDDGVTFEPSSIEVGPIREGEEYGGLRLHLTARIATALIRVQVDVGFGFGDAITPGTVEVEFPALLDFPTPRLRAYPRETVVAEKLEATVKLGLANSRMKDFYDLAVLSRLFEFDGALLVRAMRATFERRGTPLPIATPVAFTPAFTGDREKRAQWSGFARKAGVNDAGDLVSTMAAVARFAGRPLEVAAGGVPWTGHWSASGPWTG